MLPTWVTFSLPVTKARQSRTIFAQRRLRPEDVLPEWQSATAVLGGAADVQRFMARALERLDAPLHETKRGWRLATEHLPAALKEAPAPASPSDQSCYGV